MAQVNTNKVLTERVNALEEQLAELRAGHVALRDDIHQALAPFMPPAPGPYRPVLEVIQGGAR